MYLFYIISHNVQHVEDNWFFFFILFNTINQNELQSILWFQQVQQHVPTTIVEVGISLDKSATSSTILTLSLVSF